MLKRHHIFSLLFAATALSAAAVDVKGVQAGGLSKAVDADSLATSLSVSGRLNAADFAYIADRMGTLKSLDLSGCVVEAYAGSALPFSGLRSSAASQLPAYSFIGMKNLSEVTLPMDLKSIGEGAFSGSGINSVEVPAGVDSIADYAFMRCEKLEEVSLPSSVKALGYRTFANCTALKTISFAANALSALPAGTFEGCTSLSSLNLSALARCSEIGAWALAHCGSMTMLTLPEAVTTLSTGALLGDSSIKEFSLPSAVAYLGDGAMQGWNKLSEFNVSTLSHVPLLGNDVWAGIDPLAVTLVVADDLADSFKSADQWQDFKIEKLSEYTSTTGPVIDIVSDHGLSVSVSGGILTVSVSDGSVGNVALFNASGSRVAAVSSADSQVEINVSAMPRGVFLVVTDAGVAKIAL